MRRVLTGKVIQLLVGALIGFIIAGIVTGDEKYIVIIAVGVPVLFTIAMVIGVGVGARRRTSFTQAGRPPGINSTIPGAPASQTETVLNPVSTAQPSAGVVLNGELVGASPTPTPTPGAAAKPGGAQGRPVWWRALGILTIAAGAALALLPSYGTIGWIASDIAAGRPFDGRDMRTGLHQQEAWDQLVEVIGGTEVTSILFYDSYISVSAPTTPGADTVDRFEWKYGHASRVGPDYSQPSDLQQELFDVGDMDMSVVAQVVRQSLDEAQIEDVDSIYPSIRRFADEAPEINVSISGVYYDASFTYTLSGEQLQRSGSAFD
ncbi:MAG: hypothetical protein ABI566_04020 [Pseudolysinimonas sp.]